MRLRNIKGAKEAIEQHPELVLIRPVDKLGKWNTVFGNEQPIEIEIGMGKGQFIIEKAKRHPDLNFIGIERFDSVMVKAMQKVLESGELPNLKLALFDAIFIEDYFKENEVSKIYLNFSDPWPKARHEKRRLTSKRFLEKYRKILNQGGLIQFKTDNIDLFEYSVQSFIDYKMNILEINRDLHQNNTGEIIMTEYEEKFSKKGNKIYRLIAKFGG